MIGQTGCVCVILVRGVTSNYHETLLAFANWENIVIGQSGCVYRGVTCNLHETLLVSANWGIL